MIEVFFAFVLSLSATVIFYDATQNKIGKVSGEKGFFNLPAGGWALAALLLWIVALPAYLIKRSSLIKKAVEQPVETNRVGFKLALLMLAGVVMFIINLGMLTPNASQPEVAATKAPLPSITENVVADRQTAPPPASTPALPTLGLSKEQILAGLDDFLPALQSSPMGKGKDRLMGETNNKKALTLVELVGEDAKHPYYVSLMMFMPSDAPVLLLGNMTMYGAVTKNIFPGWDGNDRLNWLSESIKTLQKTKVKAGSPAPFIEKKVDDKVIRIKLAETLSAVLVTIEHKDAPQ